MCEVLQECGYERLDLPPDNPRAGKNLTRAWFVHYKTGSPDFVICDRGYIMCCDMKFAHHGGKSFYLYI
jgi:hypothetical protein